MAIQGSTYLTLESREMLIAWRLFGVFSNGLLEQYHQRYEIDVRNISSFDDARCNVLQYCIVERQNVRSIYFDLVNFDENWQRCFIRPEVAEKLKGRVVFATNAKLLQLEPSYKRETNENSEKLSLFKVFELVVALPLLDHFAFCHETLEESQQMMLELNAGASQSSEDVQQHDIAEQQLFENPNPIEEQQPAELVVEDDSSREYSIEELDFNDIVVEQQSPPHHHNDAIDQQQLHEYAASPPRQQPQQVVAPPINCLAFRIFKVKNIKKSSLVHIRQFDSLANCYLVSALQPSGGVSHIGHWVKFDEIVDFESNRIIKGLFQISIEITMW